MFLADHVQLFCIKRSTRILREILEQHGKRGFAIACKSAGISRGTGRRMLGSYDDIGAIKQVAKKECGLKTSKTFI